MVADLVLFLAAACVFRIHIFFQIRVIRVKLRLIICLGFTIIVGEGARGTSKNHLNQKNDAAFRTGVFSYA
jgi:hypothetical protein